MLIGLIQHALLVEKRLNARALAANPHLIPPALFDAALHMLTHGAAVFLDAVLTVAPAAEVHPVKPTGVSHPEHHDESLRTLDFLRLQRQFVIAPPLIAESQLLIGDRLATYDRVILDRPTPAAVGL